MIKKLLCIILGISCMALSGCYQKVGNNNLDELNLKESKLVVIFEEDVYCHEDLFGSPLESYWDFDFIGEDKGKRVKVFWGRVDEKEKKYDTFAKKYTDQYGNAVIQIADIDFYKYGELPSYKSNEIEAIILRTGDTPETFRYKRLTSKNEIKSLRQDYLNPDRSARYDYDVDEEGINFGKEIWIGVVYSRLSAVNWIGYYWIDNQNGVSLWLSYMKNGEMYSISSSNAKIILQKDTDEFEELGEK